ncbi:MAG TPA: GIY-YIG nuclease family protein [bacterium]|nr:GIY-YIG nuclease family protein [bacterium]
MADMMEQSTWFVYILRCSDGSLYTGITNCLERRLERHNRGLASRYTRSRLPVNLVYSEPQPDRSLASKREAEIKLLERTAKLDLVARGFSPAEGAETGLKPLATPPGRRQSPRPKPIEN